jgi:hypothetical protein
MPSSRAFGNFLQWVLVFPLLGLAGLTAGLALAPAIFCFEFLYRSLNGLEPWFLYPALGCSVAFCYLVYGLSILIIAPVINTLLMARLKPFRGSAVSFKCMSFYLHSVLTLIVRMTFLEFVTPTPFNLMYYRLMGMKIGHTVAINTTAIADPSMIVMEDKVTIGGTASILAHYGQGGYLVIAPVILRRGATIGLRAIIMGGVEVGENAMVLAGSFVKPNTKIPAGETWAGVPAVCYKSAREDDTEKAK